MRKYLELLKEKLKDLKSYLFGVYYSISDWSGFILIAVGLAYFVFHQIYDIISFIVVFIGIFRVFLSEIWPRIKKED